jgi:replication initiation protein RepC
MYMKHTTGMEFGRPVAACLPTTPAQATDAPEGGQDKWTLLKALTKAAPELGLGHNTITVLRALLGFFPERNLPALPGSAIVFPANRTLSERLGGMPESTLRRHIAKLVSLDLIHRHDSPNGKRFARRAGASIYTAFGFDLTPLARHASRIHKLADTVARRLEEIAAVRSSILALRYRLTEHLMAQGADEPDNTAYAELYDLTRRMLRRKVSLDDIRELEARYIAVLDNLDTSTDQTADNSSKPETMKMSGSNIQNERHIQGNKNYIFDSERIHCTQLNDTEPNQHKTGKKAEKIHLNELLSLCPTILEFFPDEISGWSSLTKCVEQIVPMLGIDMPVYLQTLKHLGNQEAVIVLLYILENFERIGNPGGYLRALNRQAQTSEFSLLPLVASLRSRVTP